jgi:hypothetical protein
VNIRQIAEFTSSYSEINREERNYAAILFAALCLPGNAAKFLHICGIDEAPGSDFGIYFEYAYLRDLWYKLDNEKVKKDIIRQHLQISNIGDILSKSVKEINLQFGVAGEPSSEYVQFPGKWAITKYDSQFPDNDDFLKICRFKWSFNIKPDIVIHLDNDRAVCIEAKYCSGEGSYPASEVEKAIFKRRELDYVGQTDLQMYMMEVLLGVRTDFLFLASKCEKSETHRVVDWAEVFRSLDLEMMPKFARTMVTRVSRGQKYNRALEQTDRTCADLSFAHKDTRR